MVGRFGSASGLSAVSTGSQVINLVTFVVSQLATGVTDSGFAVGIPDAVTSRGPVEISGVEFVPDAYEALLQAEREGRLILERCENMPEKFPDLLRED